MLLDYLSRAPGAGVLLAAVAGDGLHVHPRLVVRLLLVAELDGVAVLAVHLAVHAAARVQGDTSGWQGGCVLKIWELHSSYPLPKPDMGTSRINVNPNHMPF